MSISENGITIEEPQLLGIRPSTAKMAKVANYHFKLPISATLADAAVLARTPSWLRLLVEQMFWEVTTSFTGGTDSAIGVSASAAPHTTKGDLLGGVGGDLAAALTSVIGINRGTLGVSFSASPNMVVLPPNTDIRFDRIVDAFTAGAGFVHIVGRHIL